LLNEYSNIASVLKQVIYEDYINNIKSKILVEKTKAFQKISNRADFTHMLTIIPKNKQVQNLKFKTNLADNDNYMNIKDYEQNKSGIQKKETIKIENTLKE
jgi:hypothetical protein